MNRSIAEAEFHLHNGLEQEQEGERYFSMSIYSVGEEIQFLEF